MLPPDLEALLARVGFHERGAARARLCELAADAAELLALVRISAELGEALASCADPHGAVRRFRRREILRIGAADLCGLIDLRQTVQQLSCLADAVVVQCLHIVGDGNVPCGLIVLALGKLGGGELNYSGDIDLVYLAEP